MSKVVVMLGLVAICSCKRAPPTPPPPPPPTPVVTVVDAATAPAPSASATVEVDPNLPLKELAKKWNDAINARDIAALSAMHGTHVLFYGVTVDNATYCSKMKAALQKDALFHQTIDSIRVEWPHPTLAKVWFRKKDNHATHPAYLVVYASAGSLEIAEESDLNTDANMHCVMSADKITMTGTITRGAIFWHDTVTDMPAVTLSSPICVIRSDDDDWGEGNNDRADGVDGLMIGPVSYAIGTKVRLQGSHIQPHTGSGIHSPLFTINVDSVTPLP